MSRTLDDEPKAVHKHHDKDDVNEECTEEDSAVKNNLQYLTSVTIEVKTRHLFPDKTSQV